MRREFYRDDYIVTFAHIWPDSPFPLVTRQMPSSCWPWKRGYRKEHGLTRLELIGHAHIPRPKQRASTVPHQWDYSCSQPQSFDPSPSKELWFLSYIFFGFESYLATDTKRRQQTSSRSGNRQFFFCSLEIYSCPKALSLQLDPNSRSLNFSRGILTTLLFLIPLSIP